MKNPLLPLVKIESMSSLDIAELTGKQHKNVLRDINNIVASLKDSPDLSSGFVSSTYKAGNGKEENCFPLRLKAS